MVYTSTDYVNRLRKMKSKTISESAVSGTLASKAFLLGSTGE